MAGALPIRRKGAHFDMPSGGDLYCELRVLLHMHGTSYGMQNIKSIESN